MSTSSSSFDCVSCQLRKKPSLSFNNREYVASAHFDLIHSNI